MTPREWTPYPLHFTIGRMVLRLEGPDTLEQLAADELGVLEIMLMRRLPRGRVRRRVLQDVRAELARKEPLDNHAFHRAIRAESEG